MVPPSATCAPFLYLLIYFYAIKGLKQSYCKVYFQALRSKLKTRPFISVSAINVWLSIIKHSPLPMYLTVTTLIG